MSRTHTWVLVALGLVVGLACSVPFIASLPLFLMAAGVMALVVGLLVGATKLYRRWSGVEATRGVSALNFGLVANGAAVGLTMLSLLSAPTGGYGRPMGLVFFYFVFALVTMPIGLVKAAQAWAQEKPLAIAAMVLSIGILPVELLTFFVLAMAKAFELEA